MTGRLGNIITTYVHFIALQYRLGFQYFLPLYTDTPGPDGPVMTKPLLSRVFKNVSFPTAQWSRGGPRGDDAVSGNNCGLRHVLSVGRAAERGPGGHQHPHLQGLP